MPQLNKIWLLDIRVAFSETLSLAVFLGFLLLKPSLSFSLSPHGLFAVSILALLCASLFNHADHQHKCGTKTCESMTMSYMGLKGIPSCRQLFEEQLPRRKAQLFSLYSQSGTVPLIPDAQDPELAPLVQQFWAYPAPEDLWSFATIVNDADTALDISGWTLSGVKRLYWTHAMPEGHVVIIE